MSKGGRLAALFQLVILSLTIISGWPQPGISWHYLIYEVAVSGCFALVNWNTFLVEGVRTEILLLRPDYATTGYLHGIEI